MINILQSVGDVKTATLVGSLMEAFLEATYTLVFFASMVHQWKHSKKVNWVMHVASTLLYVLVTVHWIVGIVQLKQAFVTNGTSLLGPALYYANVSDPLELTRIVAYVTCTLIIDLLLAYRLFVVFERSVWIAIPPLLSVVGITVCFVMQMTQYVHAQSVADVLPGGSSAPWILATYGLSFVTSFYPSALITYRIVKDYMERHEANPTWDVLLPVTYTIVESAVFYSILNCVILSLYLKQSSYLWIFLGINPQFIGINFSLIFLRISIISAQRTKRISRTTFSPQASHGSSSGRSRVSKIGGLAPGEISLHTLGQEQTHSDRQSHLSLALSSSPLKDGLRPESAVYGGGVLPPKALSRANSLLVGSPPQGPTAVTLSPTRTELVLAACASQTRSVFVPGSPTRLSTPPVDSRW